MNKLYTNLIAGLAVIVSMEAAADATKVATWFKEDPRYTYYYIETDTSPASLEKYMSLQLERGWFIDLTGFADKDGNIKARFKREATDIVSRDDTPFQNSPSWFNEISRSSPVSYMYTQGVQEAFNHLQSLSRQGYQMGLMKQPLGDMKNVVITYYKAK